MWNYYFIIILFVLISGQSYSITINYWFYYLIIILAEIWMMVHLYIGLFSTYSIYNYYLFILFALHENEYWSEF